ncbi:lipocalin family protein [Gramella sp. GC03-9]|uniref:Lipocalin family protein n=1 Tax=Christiangramia oceanisediminis TaxID=2920386 RepID=A0A9X2I1G0_9FLAO|nr:lipocalin family protein [Gramella oceanisediminis]MCP9199196.1 lipocalin family protein [Gramella oceanisediminis]
MKYPHLLSCIWLAALFLSCSEEKTYQLPENAESLLHGDSTKTWKIARRYNNEVRMNMGPCFMSYRQSFSKDHQVSDNNAENDNCGPSLVGNWEFKKGAKGDPYIKISSPDIPELLNTDKDYKYFKILKLSADTLKLSFKHTQYGNTSRTITDILVREDLDIGDRYFHH